MQAMDLALPLIQVLLIQALLILLTLHQLLLITDTTLLWVLLEDYQHDQCTTTIHLIPHHHTHITTRIILEALVTADIMDNHCILHHQVDILSSMPVLMVKILI